MSLNHPPKLLNRHLWSQALANRMDELGITSRLLAKFTGIHKTSTERYRDPEYAVIHRIDSLGDLVRASMTSIPLNEEQSVRLWNDESQVIDWMNLIGAYGLDTLRLLKSQNNVLTEEEAHIVSALVQQRGWWLPWMGIPNESSDGISRDIEPEIQRAMILLQGFRQPRHRAILLSSSHPAEARHLIARLVRQDAEWHDHFRDGLYWLDAEGLTDQQAPSTLIKIIAGQRPMQFPANSPSYLEDKHTWLAWANAEGRQALIVVEHATPEIVQALISQAGPQIHFLISAIDTTPIASIAHQYLGERIAEFELSGYSTAEVARLAQLRNLELTPETQGELENWRVFLQGDPPSMRTVVDLHVLGQPVTHEALMARLVQSGHLLPAPSLWRCEPDTIERPEILHSIRQSVDEHPGSQLILHGPHGSGKTMVLKLVGNDPVLRLQFPDGVLSVEARQKDIASALSEFQIAMLLANGEWSDAKMSDLVQRLQTHLNGKRVLLFLENWTDAASARWLFNFVPPTSQMIITTSDEELSSLNIPGSQIISVPGFTLAETEQYVARRYALQQRLLTHQEQTQVPTLFDRTRGHPLSLAVALTNALARTQATVVSELGVTPAAVTGLTEELARSLQMAYAALPPEAQRCFRRLGALPELQGYDRFTFTSLWPSDLEARADELLRILDTDAGLIRRHLNEDGEPFWTIHSSVLSYACHLHQMDTPAERGHSQYWLERAAQTPSQKERYRDFRRHIARTVRGRKFWQDLILHNLPTQVPLWTRGLYFFIQPRFVIEWQVAQEHSRYFTSVEMILAFQLRREEQRSHYYPFSVWWSLVALLILTTLVRNESRWNFWIGQFFALWLLLTLVTVIRLAVVDLRRIPAWRNIWVTVSQRKKS